MSCSPLAILLLLIVTSIPTTLTIYSGHAISQYAERQDVWLLTHRDQLGSEFWVRDAGCDYSIRIADRHSQEAAAWLSAAQHVAQEIMLMEGSLQHREFNRARYLRAMLWSAIARSLWKR